MGNQQKSMGNQQKKKPQTGYLGPSAVSGLCKKKVCYLTRTFSPAMM